MQGSNYCTLYLVRHGETQSNVLGVVQGHKDSPLTEVGINQAKALGEKFFNIKFDRVFSSDLLRAKRTAEMISLERNLEIQTTAALREQRLGKLEGSDKGIFERIEKLFERYTETQKRNYFKKHGLEPTDQFISRFLTFLREVSFSHRGKTVLVVTHGGVMYNLLLHLGFWEKRPPKFPVNNTSFIKIESDGIDFFIKGTEGIST